jgi:hypothetical protein
MVSADATSTATATEHRLHISGLTPQISPADLKERFQRYGNVEAVDTVGPDALGRSCQDLFALISDDMFFLILRPAEELRIPDNQREAAGFDKVYAELCLQLDSELT